MLFWYKKNEHKYFILSIITQDVLTATPSKVALESTFNLIYKIIDVEWYSICLEKHSNIKFACKVRFMLKKIYKLAVLDL